MRGPESIKYMHMIHCICLNRAQQWPTAVCLLFSAASAGRDRNLGLVSKIGTFLGPNWNFGPIWDQVLNLGPFWSAWFVCSTRVDHFWLSRQIWTPVTLSWRLHSFKTSENSNVFEYNSREEGRGLFLSRFYIYLQIQATLQCARKTKASSLFGLNHYRKSIRLRC